MSRYRLLAGILLAAIILSGTAVWIILAKQPAATGAVSSRLVSSQSLAVPSVPAVCVVPVGTIGGLGLTALLGLGFWRRMNKKPLT